MSAGRRSTEDDIVTEVVPTAHPDAQWCLEQYFAHLDREFPDGFDPSAGGGDDDEQNFTERGVFLLLRDRALDADARPVGCGAVTSLSAELSEVKRMWIAPSHRGRGLGGRLLAELEAHARQLGHTEACLDTNENLPNAIAMYRHYGYADVARYNDNPYATHFFRKRL
ncbi:MAG: GNAT family N-acetyltransferase [Acidimicrobiales bacterium]|nr:GNAT family N-acetyltransferase [Acidimicrobiales bacterium]